MLRLTISMCDQDCGFLGEVGLE